MTDLVHRSDLSSSSSSSSSDSDSDSKSSSDNSSLDDVPSRPVTPTIQESVDQVTEQIQNTLPPISQQVDKWEEADDAEGKNRNSQSSR